MLGVSGEGKAHGLVICYTVFVWMPSSNSLPNLNVNPLRSLPRDEEKKKGKENTKEKRGNSADGGKQGTFTAQQVTTVVPASRLKRGGLDGLLMDT